MRKIFIIIISIFIAIPCFAQQVKDSATQSTEFHIDHSAEFPGGNMLWIKYLQRSMNRDIAHKYLTLPKGQRSVKQTVNLIFEIDTEGHTSNIVVENLTEVHIEIAKEGIRVIKESPKWNPALQNGKPFIDTRRQKLSFSWGE